MSWSPLRWLMLVTWPRARYGERSVISLAPSLVVAMAGAGLVPAAPR